MKKVLLVMALILLSLSVFSAPIIGIHSPKNNSVFSEGENIKFVAFVADQFYGNFGATCGYPNNPNNDCFYWFGNGELIGKGTVLNKVFSKGVHEIYFSAVNPEGKVTTDSRTIFVGVNPFENNPPEFSSLPNVFIKENSGYSSKVIDLWSHVFDEKDNVFDLEFRIINQSNTGLIHCSIQGNRWIDCGAPTRNRTGTSFVVVEVKNTSSGKTDTASFRVEVYGYSPYNTPPKINLPSVMEINYFDEFKLLDLYSFVWDYEDSFNELILSVENQSNSMIANCFIYNKRYLKCFPFRKGYSYVNVKVMDSGGLSDFDSIKIVVEEFSDKLELNLPNTWYLNEKDFIQTLDLRNYTKANRLHDVDYSITRQTNLSNVDCYISNNRYLKCNPKKEGISTITIKAKEKGKTVFDSIKVIVEKDYQSGNCGDMRINTYFVTLKEKTTEFIEFELKNNSSKRFYVTELTAYDNLSWINSSMYSFPRSVSGYGTESFKVRINAGSVLSDRTGTGYIKLKGYYSGKSTCTKIINYSIKVLTEDFKEKEFDSIDAEIRIEKKAITLNKGESETINLIVENKSNLRECFNLSVSTTSNYITAELNEKSFCLNSNQKKNLSLRILAETNAVFGWESVTLTTEFKNKTDKQSISVNVRGTSEDKVIETEKIKLIQYPKEIELNEEKELNFIIQNTGKETIRNVLISVIGLPEGIEFKPILIDFISGNTTRTLKGKLMISNEAESGKFNSLIEIQAENQLIEKEINILIPEKQETGMIAGLINLMEETGLAVIIGLILLLSIGIIVIYSIITKK